MKRKYGVIIALSLAWHVAFIHEGQAQKISPESPSYQKALAVAKTVDSLIRATRKHYTDMVVKKLVADGAGASSTYQKDKGFVPLPANFINRVISEIMTQQSAAKQRQYDVKIVSKWNINKHKDLTNEFSERGWAFLDKQQEQHRDAGKNLAQLSWEPYIEVGHYRDQLTLHYISADPASARECVACHNTWEQKKEIKQRRRRQGIEAGKTFKYGELLGAVVIAVPLE